ncbi:MAG: YetF domain-containing protein [Pontixanthobacter sp.]
MGASDKPLWFSDWTTLGEIALTCVLFFALIVALTLVSGKRTTGQMNNFDWIVTVVVGSLAASGILLDNVTVIDAGFAIFAILACQYALTWLSVRSETVTKLIKDEPTLLVNQGEYLKDAMLRTRVTESEVKAALRGRGLAKLEDVNWVILETEGTLSVIAKKDVPWGDARILHGVQTPDSMD